MFDKIDDKYINSNFEIKANYFNILLFMKYTFRHK